MSITGGTKSTEMNPASYHDLTVNFDLDEYDCLKDTDTKIGHKLPEISKGFC